MQRLGVAFDRVLPRKSGGDLGLRRALIGLAVILAAVVPAGLGQDDVQAALDAGSVRSPARVAAPVRLARSGAVQAAVLARGPLDTGMVDVQAFADSSSAAAVAFKMAKQAGITAIRLGVYWKDVAPDGATAPPGFRAADHRDPAYRWGTVDRQVRLAATNGLKPILSIEAAPRWAERGTGEGPGTRRPDPAALAAFARAAAVRYNGRSGLPRVRYWQAWNEPNFYRFLNPPSPDVYRELVNAFSDAVHGVRRDNRVIAGGTSPFGFPNVAVPPLEFMRELLCMSAGAAPRPTCSSRIRFDIWSHHPYTTGGPTHQAQKADDVSLGDLPEMRRLLLAAVRVGHVVPRAPIRFWVTEFSWDSRPPDPLAVPSALHARWVAEALYRMWQSGVSLVTWFQLRDDTLARSEFQSGLYLNSGRGYRFDRAKLALRAFRFPFVAFSSAGLVTVWGRTPAAKPGSVIVDVLRGSHWSRVARLRANGYGIFSSRLRAAGTLLRARLVKGGERSLPFSLERPPDQYFWPFGCGGILACTARR